MTSVIGPSNLDVTDLGPNPMTSADVMSTIAPEAGEPTDVGFILRMVMDAYYASYPPDVIYGPPTTPAITTLTPNSIVVDTPTLCTIDGTGFRPDSRVWVDGVEQPTVFVSPTQLRYTAEASSVGSQDVTVQTDTLESNVLVMTVTATAEEPAVEGQSTSPPAAPDAVPPPEAPPDSGGGVTGGRKPRNGNGGKRLT